MKIKRNPSIYSKKIKGKWVILEKNKQHIRELNETAGFFWELTRKTISTAQLSKKLRENYKVSIETAKKDTNKWANSYLKKKLLVKVS